MNWYFKKMSETEDIIEIGFSYGVNETCDGILLYDKKTLMPTVVKNSEGPNEYANRKCGQFVHHLVRDNKLSEQVVRVCSGG